MSSLESAPRGVTSPPPNVPRAANDRGRKRGSDLEFLPAALEIVETPASPVGRAIGLLIILFFAVALGWATLGHVDIIATAPGKVVPSGRTKIIQPFDTGVVREIRVQDNQEVKKGDVLIELDPTISAAEVGRLRQDLIAQRLQVARLQAILTAHDQTVNFVPPLGATPAQIFLQRTLLTNQMEEQRAKLANIDRQIVQNEATRAGTAAQVDKLKASIPIIKQRVAAYKMLLDDGNGAQLQYLQNWQDEVEHEEDLEATRAKLTESDASIAALQEQRQQAGAEFLHTNLSDLADAEQKVASSEQQLLQAEERQRLETLVAPVDGTVQQVAIHTVGGVVTPAQQLMAIVPADSPIEIEAMVSNRDIGFVRAGQRAEIKIDTFNFTRYGLLHGDVKSVSQDAIQRDKPADKSGDSSDSLGESSEPDGQQLVYSARIALDTTQMNVDGRLVNLAPGMAVTAEIKTGSRRVIEYLLAPLLRYKQESLRER
jgi:membrane fusion protein, hemolysin D